MTTTKTAPKPRSQRADARRNHDKVLTAARAQFAEHGLETSMEAIARDAEVGVGTIYRHFPTKEDLLQALADDRFEGLAAAARAALEVKDPWEAFAGFMTHSAQVMATDRALSEAMDQLPCLCSSAAARVDMLGHVGAVIARAQQSGDLRADVVAEDVPALICGLGSAIRSEVERPTMSWERYLEIILTGLRA